MKSILSFLVLAALWPMKVMANPACVVCTVAIGASLEVARKLGVSDAVVGLWTGAVLALLGYWAILWFDRKGDPLYCHTDPDRDAWRCHCQRLVFCTRGNWLICRRSSVFSIWTDFCFRS